MILIFGGNGFVGQHVARYLVERGEQVVVTTHSRVGTPVLLADDIEAARVVVAPLDVTDSFGVVGLVAKYRPRVVIDLSGHSPKVLAPGRDVSFRVSALLNILESARLNHVARVVLMSSLDAYWGLDLTHVPFREDANVPLLEQDDHFIVQSWVKKSLEVIGNLYRRQHGMDVVFPRASGVYGPLYRTYMHIPSRFVRAAVRNTGEFSIAGQAPYAEDGYDLTYVKDIARGIGLIALAQTLAYPVYNIGSGRAPSYGEFARAVRAAVPGFEIELPSRLGRGPQTQAPGSMDGRWMDISRARIELGYQPQFSVDAAIADYADWLRAHDN